MRDNVVNVSPPPKKNKNQAKSKKTTTPKHNITTNKLLCFLNSHYNAAIYICYKDM